MANSPSARKRIRQTLKRTARHGARRSRARRFVRFCEEAMASMARSTAPSAKELAKDKAKDKKTAKSSSPNSDKGSDKSTDEGSAPISLDEHFRRATAELYRAAQKGALHRKAVARKVSRLAKRLKALTQEAGKEKNPSTKDAPRA